jgi:hypothetical protein
MTAHARTTGIAPALVNRWTVAAWAYGLLVVAVLAHFLVAIPVQFTDSFGNILKVGETTLGSLVYEEFYQRAYLRPFLFGHLKVVYDLSGGHYFEAFRGFHVVQVLLLVVLFLRLVRPQSPSGVAAVALGLAALVGMHTFIGTVNEAFPINTFMTVLLCCFLAADLALGPPSWWRDVAAALLFVFAALTVESGLLVAVVFVAAFLTGGRGVSRAGVAAVVLLFAGYVYLRVEVLDVGSPGLEERSSGFGFSTREPEELLALFGGNPLPFYAYNVGSSLLSVLFSEPRGGLFLTTRRLLADDLKTMDVVNVVASTMATMVIAGFAWSRRREWWARRFDRSDRLVLMFVAVAAANAVISFAYTKDVIMSPAGAFFALALGASASHAIDAASRSGVFRQAAIALVLLVVACTWSFRVAAAHLELRVSAAKTRNEWAYVDQWLERERQNPTGRAAELKNQLQAEALFRRPAPVPLTGDWLEWFEN